MDSIVGFLSENPKIAPSGGSALRQWSIIYDRSVRRQTVQTPPSRSDYRMAAWQSASLADGVEIVVASPVQCHLL